MSEIAELESQLAAAVSERDNWIETARMHAKNEAYYRDLIVTTLTGTPAAFVSDDGSVQQDVLCAKLPELYATAVAAREETEADVARLERLHAACDPTIRGLTSKALAAVRGQEAAEARAAEAERRVAELEARGHDGQPCTTERPCCVCEGRIDAEASAEKAERERDAYRHEWNVSSRQQGAETRARYAAEARAERLKFQIEREIVFLEDEAATGVSFYEATFTQRAQALRAAIAAEEGK